MSPLPTPAAPLRASPYPLIPFSTAQNTISTCLTPVPTELLPPAAAHHRRLAAAATSPADVPAFRASVKDGYAVRARDAPPLPATLPLATPALAGAAPPPLPPGHAAYITTGAPLPPGADAVVMVERTRGAGDGCVEILAWPHAPGEDVRGVGADVAAGTVVLERGAVVGAAEVGLLAACGVASVEVYREVVVGVLSTGDELDGEGVGAVVDSNRPMLLCAARDALPACRVVDLGAARDEYGALRDKVAAAAAVCDVVVSSGGVSMGARDVVKPVLAALGDVRFGRVCIKPGKPLTFATLPGNKCAVALPGNPVSAFVMFHVAAVVAAKVLSGCPPEEAKGVVRQVRLAHEIALDRARPELHRATLEWRRDGYVARSTGAQASSRLLSARSAHALLMLPAAGGGAPDDECCGGTPGGVLREGAVVDAYLLQAI